MAVCFLLIVIEFVGSLAFAFGRLVSCVSLVSSRSFGLFVSLGFSGQYGFVSE